MNFKDYFLTEAFLNELPIIAKNYNIEEVIQFENEAWEAAMDMSKMMLAFDVGLPERDCKLSYDGRTTLLKRLKPKALRAIIIVHETEYKISQIKKFHGNVDVDYNPFLIRLCEYVRHYILGIMAFRVADDIMQLIPDKERDSGNGPIAQSLLKQPTNILRQMVIKNLDKQIVYSRKNAKEYNYDLVYKELLNAKTLPKLLIAISKALNAEHDRGSLVTNKDEENLNSYEPPISIKELAMVSNLNYRKLDAELNDEMAK